MKRLRMFADWRPFVSLRHRPPGEKRFLLLVPLTGVVTGLASVALIRLLGLVQGLFWGSRHEMLDHALALPAWHRFLVPTLGGAIIGLLIFVTRQPVGGHGTAALIEAVAQRGGVLHLGRSLLKAGATIITVGTGGSLGREGPLIRVGAALGSVLRRRFRLSGNRLNILLGCGAAAGIAAAYNAPIGGALFALEVILGNFALESFGPIVGIIRAKDEEDAIALANDSEYGLSAAVFTRDTARGLKVARRIRSGICHVNGPTVHDEPQMPFGGVGASGYGRFGGKAGIDSFTELRWITIETEPGHYPF